jgi:hypothetical protein
MLVLDSKLQKKLLKDIILIRSALSLEKSTSEEEFSKP